MILYVNNIMNKKDIIILSCIKYRNGDTSSKHQSESWDNIKNNFKDNLLFIFYGDINQKELFIYKKDKKELSIKTSDEYDNIPTKTWLAYYFWYYKIENKNTHLVTFGDDCYLYDEKLLLNANFNDIHYGGVRIHGPKWTNNWHQRKVLKTSNQYNKISPRKNMETKWVHEGTGVIFSMYAIQKLLEKHFSNDITETQINNFTKYVYNNCWYNDVLLSSEFFDLQIIPKQVSYFGIKGDM